MERSFGEYLNGSQFKVLDEREVRASAGIMFFLALIAFINVDFFQRFYVVSAVSGFLMINFMIGIFINPKYAPTMMIAKMIVKDQSALPIGAIQKKFAWGLGLGLAITIFVLSLFLLGDLRFFKPVCLLCLICIALIF